MRAGVFGSLFLAACGGGTLAGQNDGGASGGGAMHPEPAPLPSGGSCDPSVEPIASWFLAGSSPASYETGFDSSMTCNGDPSLHLSSSSATNQDFGTLMTEKAPGAWAGKRLRITGWVKAADVTGWAGLWMRVDTAAEMGAAFDNMQCRPIAGTTGWQRYEVVLDVAPDAALVAYGILLADDGEVWLDGVSVDVVDASVPTTGCP